MSDEAMRLSFIPVDEINFDASSALRKTGELMLLTMVLGTQAEIPLILTFSIF